MPDDTTPDPRDMQRVPEEQQIPTAGREVAGKPDMTRRPKLPERPHATVDVEDPAAPQRRDSNNDPGESDSELNRG